VNVTGPTDFTRWYSPVGTAIMLGASMSQAEKVSASPYLRLCRAAESAAAAVRIVAPYDQCTRYIAAASQANTDTQLQSMTNAHGQSVADRARVRNWIKERWPGATLGQASHHHHVAASTAARISTGVGPSPRRRPQPSVGIHDSEILASPHQGRAPRCDHRQHQRRIGRHADPSPKKIAINRSRTTMKSMPRNGSPAEWPDNHMAPARS